jgi:hypothetical protein
MPENARTRLPGIYDALLRRLCRNGTISHEARAAMMGGWACTAGNGLSPPTSFAAAQSLAHEVLSMASTEDCSSSDGKVSRP